MNVNMIMIGGVVCRRFFMLANWMPPETFELRNLSFLKNRNNCHPCCLQPWTTERFNDKTTWIGNEQTWNESNKKRISSKLQYNWWDIYKETLQGFGGNF